jgi:hypothetical protein
MQRLYRVFVIIMCMVGGERMMCGAQTPEPVCDQYRCDFGIP